LEARIKNIFKKTEETIDLILIKNSSEPFIDENFFYVTNLYEGLFEGSIALIYPDGSLELIVSKLEAEIAKKSKANISVYSNGTEFKDIIDNLLSNKKKIGLNFQRISYLDVVNLKKKYPDIEFIDISNSINKSRVVKDDYEIKMIKKACSIADEVLKKIPELLISNMSENEIAAEIIYHMYKNDADCPAFETISSFGENTSKPHYSHGDRKLKPGDLCLFDFGARFRKYNSDITRTFIFGSKNVKQIEMYETVKEAQAIAFDHIRPGVKAKEIHNLVQNYIDNTKFKGKFIHSTGHSLGLSVHDPSIRFSSECEILLEENMILTVEPGVYIPGFGGIRIEDDILVTNNGVDILTKSPRELIEI
jgi:Xaa-Pro dipeptidase